MQHLACIMDGNRRYAHERGWHPLKGHEQGVETVRIAIEFCLRQSIAYLSLYTFSLENMKRTDTEKSFLFQLLDLSLKKYVDELIEKKVKLKFIGDRTLFPQSIVSTIINMEERTSSGNALQLNILFCYGGKQEIADAAKQIARKVKEGHLHEDEIDEELVAEHLWSSCMPDPDLVMRSGGVQRISNFLLYRSAYSEYYFTDRYWPALTQEDFQQGIDTFYARKRNFGV